MCLQFAEELKKKIKENNIKAEIVTIETEDKTSFYGSIYSILNDKLIATNGYHIAIKLGDTIFDNNKSEGVSYKEWNNFDIRGKFKLDIKQI